MKRNNYTNYFQPTFDGYYNCLDTWNTFLDFIHTKERTAEWKSIITRYTLFLFFYLFEIKHSRSSYEMLMRKWKIRAI